MLRLAEGIYTWGYFNAEKGYNFNGFLLRDAGVTIVVDPPPLSEDDEAYFRKLDAWPDLIVITNRNHLRARDWFLKQKPMITAMHEAEAAQVDIAVDRKLKDGDPLPGNLKVVHLPGKSPGEIALYWKERGVLLIGDALIGDPPGSLRLLPDAKLDDPALLRKSVQKLRSLEFDVLLLADGDPILRDGKARVEKFLRALQTP